MNKCDLRFAVLGSTRGSSLKPILKARSEGILPADLALVVSNRLKSGILDLATEHGIASKHLPAKGLERGEYDLSIHEVLREYEIDFVLLIGYMRILSSELVNRWEGLIVNIHPSLLPKHGGLMDLAVHQAVLDAGERESGCSLHIVSEEVDEGPVIIQKHCSVSQSDTPESLKVKVQKLEGECFIEFLSSPRTYLKALV